MQLQWAERDSYTVDSLKPYIGARRCRYTYPAGTPERAGARLCGGSDWLKRVSKTQVALTTVEGRVVHRTG